MCIRILPQMGKKSFSLVEATEELPTIQIMKEKTGRLESNDSKRPVFICHGPLYSHASKTRR